MDEALRELGNFIADALSEERFIQVKAHCLDIFQKLVRG